MLHKEFRLFRFAACLTAACFTASLAHAVEPRIDSDVRKAQPETQQPQQQAAPAQPNTPPKSENEPVDGDDTALA